MKGMSLGNGPALPPHLRGWEWRQVREASAGTWSPGGQP